jgi:phosphate transport system protein
LARLMDMGLERLTKALLEMADLSENTVTKALEAYTEGKDLRDTIFSKSEQLRVLQDDVSELATEMIARYQPVATDLRYLTSCMEIAYGFSRFGRYAYDISDVLVVYGDLSTCDKTTVLNAGDRAKEMIRVSIRAFRERDAELAKRLSVMDDEVDKIYRDYLHELNRNQNISLKCAVSATLVLRYFERIADHATYIGDSVIYIITGQRVQKLQRLEDRITGLSD